MHIQAIPDVVRHPTMPKVQHEQPHTQPSHRTSQAPESGTAPVNLHLPLGTKQVCTNSWTLAGPAHHP